METAEDLYAEEGALFEDTEDHHQDPEIEEPQDDTQGDEDKDDEKKPVKPKRVIKNPRPKLDVESLKGRKGLLCLEGYLKHKKFKGRGHEEEDLRYIMKTYEYWCHRLYPKFSFDDCLSKLEKLGTKKNVQVYMKRIRMDLIFDDEQPIRSDDEGHAVEEGPTATFQDIFQNVPDTEETMGLSEEQLERIRLNRERANQLRQIKLNKQSATEVSQGDENITSMELSNECVPRDFRDASRDDENTAEVQNEPIPSDIDT